jgi:hypothetical protein
MDDKERRSAFGSAMTTEHFVLRTAISTTINEGASRASRVPSWGCWDRAGPQWRLSQTSSQHEIRLFSTIPRVHCDSAPPLKQEVCMIGV